MESKIMIDIDNEGSPVIRIDHKISRDVRDRLVARFMSSNQPLELGDRLLYALEIIESDKDGIVGVIIPLNEIRKS